MADVSRAILNVTEGNDITQIEDHWFKDHSSCSRQNSNPQSLSRSFRSFAGLFIITGVVSVLMLLIFVGKYIYTDWDKIKELWRSSDSISVRLRELSMRLDRMDSSVRPVHNDHNRFSTDRIERNDVILTPVQEKDARVSHQSPLMASPPAQEGAPVLSESDNLTGQVSDGHAMGMEQITEGR